MPIKDYSTTAANNTLTPPNGAPEGMAAGLVNNTIRQVMADTRSWYESGGWCDFNHVPTFVSTTSFTIPTDVTAFYTVGRRIRMFGTIMGTLYGYIVSSAYSAPNTTITVVLDSGALTSNLSRVDLAFTEQEAQRLADAAVTTAKIANNAVSNAKMAIMGANTVKMNNTVSAATPIDASMFQLNEVLSSVLCIKKQSFITSGTYTPSAGMLYCIIEAWGGGGGGGGAIIVPGASNAGGGGGAGSYSRHLATAADIGISKSVVIGAFGAGGAAGFNAGAAGGNTTLGTSIVIASGGSGGGGGSASVGGTGGGGGLANTGNIIAGSGMDGGNGFSIGNILAYPIGGYGGSTSIGSGASPVGGPQATSQVGNIGVGYGAGGGGGITFNNGASAAGGNGASGLLVITEFCKQY